MREVVTRALQVLSLEAGARRYPRELRTASYRTLPARWSAALTGRRRAPWLTSTIVYEARFECVLMHMHQRLVQRLLAVASVPHGGYVLDVGANVGQFGIALLAARPDLQLVSVEPNPAAANLLAQNAASHASRWMVMPVGISTTPGGAELWYVQGRSAQGSLYRENADRDMIGVPEQQLASTTVELITASMLLQRLPIDRPFDLIKVDVEGHELSVLETLAPLRPRYLLVELSEGVSAADAESVLRAGGSAATNVFAFGRDVLFELGRAV